LHALVVFPDQYIVSLNQEPDVEENDKYIQPDSVEEKRINRNLAIGVGVLGVGMFGLFYTLFFFVMILRPGMVFKLMPAFSITDAAISDGSTTYLLLQKVDMSKIDPRKKQQPEVKHFLSVLYGSTPGEAQEIPPFANAYGANGRLLFLSKGEYRIYEGTKWITEQSGAIGKGPQGLLAPDGLYVLSRSDSGQRLTRIASGSAVDLPLPADYLVGSKKDPCCCAKMVLYQNRLCLFWATNEIISWSILQGTTWSPPATSPFSGEFKIVSDNSSLYFFHGAGEGPDRILSYYVYKNDAWSGPMRLPVPDDFIKWDVFIQQGKLRLFVQKFTMQTLYSVEKDALSDPIQLDGPFHPFRLLGRIAFIIVLINALTFLVVFVVSAVIRRFKKLILKTNEAEYEFASLFRRFLAIMIDNVVILLPPAIVLALFMPDLKNVSGKPFVFMFSVFCAMAFFFIFGFLYHALLEGLYGQTLGKKICGIQVVKSDFSACGLSAGFLRNLLRIADAFFYYLVAVISLAGTLKWQRLGDLVADTVVVRKTR
jgi:uncharacterized RDD family membrane protein YckC